MVKQTIPVRASYYRARYYDPSAGRFISEDPIRFEAKQTSFYPYVKNSPANYVDPSGLSAWNKTKAFMACTEGCLKTMLTAETCELKKHLIRVAWGGPALAVGVCGVVVISEPYLAPAFVPCVAITTVSNWVVGTSIAIFGWNFNNMTSGVGCTAFCAMNELK
jgi:RHS repeat-associated protein